MDREKALSALRVDLVMGGILFAAFLGDHAVGISTIPAWSLLEFLRGLFLSLGGAFVFAALSYLYQTGALNWLYGKK